MDTRASSPNFSNGPGDEANYDPNKELILAHDASPYRLGTVLFNHSEDRQEQTIVTHWEELVSATEGSTGNSVCSETISSLSLWCDVSNEATTKFRTQLLYVLFHRRQTVTVAS